MNAELIVIIPEVAQLSHQIARIPEEHSVKILTANGADQPFDERMRNWGVRNRLDLLDIENA